MIYIKHSGWVLGYVLKRQNDPSNNYLKVARICTLIKLTMYIGLAFNLPTGGTMSVALVNIALRNSCRWSTKLMEVLNNKTSSLHKGNWTCIHQNLFRSPKHNKILLVKTGWRKGKRLTWIKWEACKQKCEHVYQHVVISKAYITLLPT